MSYPVKKYGDFLLVNPVNPTGGNRYVKALTRRQRRRMGYPRYVRPKGWGYEGSGIYDYTLGPLVKGIRKITRGTANLINAGYNAILRGTVLLSGVDSVLHLAQRGLQVITPYQYVYIISALLMLLTWLGRLGVGAVRAAYATQPMRPEDQRTIQNLQAELRMLREEARANEAREADRGQIAQLRDIIQRMQGVMNRAAPAAQAAVDAHPAVAAAVGVAPMVLPPPPAAFGAVPLDRPLVPAVAHVGDADDPIVLDDDDVPRVGHGYHPYGYGYPSAYMYSMSGQPYTINGAGLLGDLFKSVKKKAMPFLKKLF